MRTKISNPNWEHKVKFNDGSTTLLIIEESDAFREYICELQNQAEGNEGHFVLSEENDTIPFKDRFAIVTNPLQVEFTDKRIQTKINALMKASMSNEAHYETLSALLSSIESFAIELEESFPFEVEHAEPEGQSLLKMLAFSLKTDYQNQIEKIIEYTNVLHDICSIDHFAFVSMFDYFNEKTMETFIRECNSNKHNILLIERHDIFTPDDVQKILIDHDLCEVFE